MKVYNPPELANPGNIIQANVGGNHMGSALAHRNEAPYPEDLPYFFINTHCPPGGVVHDPFAGSGTTLAVAKQLGRRYVGFDIRPCQVALSQLRVDNVTPDLPLEDSLDEYAAAE
jgi:DNA modification methylase